MGADKSSIVEIMNLGILHGMSAGESYATWVEIDLSAIEQNVNYFCSNSATQVMAVVKANAYGHGAVPVARAALKGGASWLGVARVEEALELRQAGVGSPILLLGFTPPGRVDEAISQRVSLAVWTLGQVHEALAAARRVGAPARLHLKIDTGMARLGVQPEEALGVASSMAASSEIVFEGVFTHLAKADEADQTTSDWQERVFLEVLEAFRIARIPPSLVHIANSAASLTRPSPAFNLIRPGIAIYGLQPSEYWSMPSILRPALEWKTTLSHLKILPPGRGVSYSHRYFTSSTERIGTLPVGYADGFRRVSGNQALIEGKIVPVIGRVCMDQVMVLLQSVPECKAGSEVVLIGVQGDACITAEQVAARWGTIAYEVVCAISPRVARLYV